METRRSAVARRSGKGSTMSASSQGSELQGRRVAFLVANEGVEQIELTGPWKAVEAAGGVPTLISPEVGKVQAFDHLDKAEVFEATLATADARVEDFDGLVLPGGVANPDQLRMNRSAVRFVREMVRSGRPVAVICHGPWTLVEADVLNGRRITSWPSLQTDLSNAGAKWVDAEVIVCDYGPGVIVSSRKPDDLPAFEREMLTAFAAPGNDESDDAKSPKHDVHSSVRADPSSL